MCLYIYYTKLPDHLWRFDCITQTAQVLLIFLCKSTKTLKCCQFCVDKLGKEFVKRSIHLEAERLIKTLDLSGGIHINGIIGKKDDVIDLIFNSMQYIIYLTAINAEIEPVTKQAITKKLTAPAINEYSNKTQSKTQISTVGYRFGNEYRRYKRYNTEQSSQSASHSGGGKGVKKTPHIRRSHFHSFWTGKKDNPDDRKLVVKWLQSVFVGSSEYDSENSGTTVHKVK